MSHVMLDIETLGTLPGCAVVSIGAVQFDLGIDELGQRFYERIDLDSCTRAGLKIEASTLLWWFKQDPEAQQGAFNVAKSRSLEEVLDDFAAYLPYKASIWANGATFDPPLVQALYTALDKPVPWDFRLVRDQRTIVALAQAIDPTWKLPSRKGGVAHDALDDAIHQVRVVNEAFGVLAARKKQSLLGRRDG